MQEVAIKKIATELKKAQDDCAPLVPITSRFPNFTMVDGYKVADLIHEQRLEEG